MITDQIMITYSFFVGRARSICDLLDGLLGSCLAGRVLQVANVVVGLPVRAADRFVVAITLISAAFLKDIWKRFREG